MSVCLHMLYQSGGQRKGCQRTWRSLILKTCWPVSSGNIPAHTFPALELEVLKMALYFLRWCWDLNLASLAWAASSLPTEPSPWLPNLLSLKPTAIWKCFHCILLQGCIKCMPPHFQGLYLVLFHIPIRKITQRPWWGVPVFSATVRRLEWGNCLGSGKSGKLSSYAGEG